MLAKFSLRLYLVRVSKQRPSRNALRQTASPIQPPPPGFKAAYWRRRLFKNTFTRDGQRTTVKNWSVKIQHQGRRRTFSLAASDRNAAAQEAWGILQTILAHGWEAVPHPRARFGVPANDTTGAMFTQAAIGADAEYWKRRLIHRKYLEPSNSQVDRELSVRIEHARTSHYFPLGTSDETRAAGRARRIYQTIVNQGWASANADFPRELTLALRWLDNPLAWTYVTLHSRKRNDPFRPISGSPHEPSKLGVAVIEPDDGIRFALAACANHQEGFRCDAMFVNAAEALQKIPRRPIHLILSNHSLPDKSGAECVEELQRLHPHLAGLRYSVYEDSDQLFKATPGGAVGYLLKRTAASRIFEPIAEALRKGPLTPAQVATCVREYFQKVFAALPTGPSSLDMAKLTPREHEILTLLSTGDLAKEIADTLGISVWTVHGHVKHIFEKLHVHNRTEAVVKFLQK